ncbi:hypothetical protein ACH5RR_009770 [Cinchona calisaya]|uniref:Uncharacterized protein n=1 Tax=Cinchona calisaya TaxID=153742 RepID=A0ABD3AIH8_9GENT
MLRPGNSSTSPDRDSSSRERTFGVVAKLDLMDKGSNAPDVRIEHIFLMFGRVLEGRSERLQHPWVGIVSCSQAEINKNHLESVIRQRILSIIALINKTIDELNAELDCTGWPIGVDGGLKVNIFFSISSIELPASCTNFKNLKKKFGNLKNLWKRVKSNGDSGDGDNDGQKVVTENWWKKKVKLMVIVATAMNRRWRLCCEFCKIGLVDGGNAHKVVTASITISINKGLLVKKARKFAKKNLHSVLPQRRKHKAFAQEEILLFHVLEIPSLARVIEVAHKGRLGLI